MPQTEYDMGSQTRRRFRSLRLAMLALQGLLILPAHSATGDIALGAYLSAECVTCHQLSGTATGGVPPIVGMPHEAFVAALMAYKTGIRDNQVMRGVTARLGPDEMAALAAYFAAQKP